VPVWHAALAQPAVTDNAIFPEGVKSLRTKCELRQCEEMVISDHLELMSENAGNDEEQSDCGSCDLKSEKSS
jgi:hypothetical protein